MKLYHYGIYTIYDSIGTTTPYHHVIALGHTTQTELLKKPGRYLVIKNSRVIESKIQYYQNSGWTESTHQLNQIIAHDLSFYELVL